MCKCKRERKREREKKEKEREREREGKNFFLIPSLLLQPLPQAFTLFVDLGEKKYRFVPDFFFVAKRKKKKTKESRKGESDKTCIIV